MAKPPPSGPHSDIEGVNRDARAGSPNRDPQSGSAEAVDEGTKEKKGKPPNSGVDSRD